MGKVSEQAANSQILKLHPSLTFRETPKEEGEEIQLRLPSLL